MDNVNSGSGSTQGNWPTNQSCASDGPDPASQTSNIPLSTDRLFNNELERKYFTLTAQAAREAGPYDIIIVGTGIGGGVLAGDLFDTNSKLGDGAKKILVIEKGNLVFHSYCLNSARPGGAMKDRGHQNGVFFSTFRSNYDVQGTTGNWKGGPMHCLGGRSTTWGLYAPRMHDTALQSCFTPTVQEELTSEFYEKVEILMNLALPPTKTIHQQIMERLNMDETGRKADVQWQWGRRVSSKGAFSTVDKLLEIATSKPEGQTEHKNFKILLGVEAREIVWKDGKTAGGVKVRTSSGEEINIELANDGKVVLCAGSVTSPAILLRSGADVQVHPLKDHDIFYKIQSFRYQDPSVRSEVGPMKLQTYVSLGREADTLANLCLDSSGFLPRGKGVDDNTPKFVITFTTRKSTGWSGAVQLNSDREPVINISSRDSSGSLTPADLQKMENVTKGAMKTIKDLLKVEFLDLDEVGKTPDEFADQYPEADGPSETRYFQRLRMGAIGHEMGTLPMVAGGEVGTVDEDLRLRGYQGVHICDLSTFRGLPDGNPSLTLAALSIRLSRLLLPHANIVKPKEEELKVVNHSGEAIKVWASDQGEAAGEGQNQEVRLGPGQLHMWSRKSPQAIFIFRRNPRVLSEEAFFATPEVIVGFPGRLLPIM